MLFDVRVTAFDPQAAVDPVEALMRLFKIERSFAREVVHRLPRVIKRGVPLDTARRLSQVLERIGARVEILISERADGQPTTASEKAGSKSVDTGAVPTGAPHSGGQQSSTPHGGMSRSTGRGLPPPSAAAVAQAPQYAQQPSSHQSSAHHAAQPTHQGPAALAALVRRSAPQTQPRASLPNAASLANPALQSEAQAGAREREADSAGRPISGVLEARAARSLREQAAQRASQPQPGMREARRPEARAVDPRLVETHSETRVDGRAIQPTTAQPFESEMPSASVRALLKQAMTDDAGLGGRLSLPMGSWSDAAEGEDSRVSAALARASLPGGSLPDNGQLRPSQVGLPAPKPSVKEILARRTLSPPERSSRAPGEITPVTMSGSPRLLTLPTFAARGASLADEIDDLPGVAEQRRKLAVVSWALLLLSSLASAGLFFVLMAAKLVSQRRRRLLELCELQASALLVGPSQLPELYNCVKQLAIRLEISPSPRLYVAERTPRKVQSYVQRGGLVIVLDAGLLGSVSRLDAGYIVQFALAHEMAAYALGQHGALRGALAGLWSKVKKGDLLSADALAAKAMPDRGEPVRALASLLCGPELAHLVDLSELERQTTSQEQEARAHGDASEDASFLLTRIQHLRRAAQSK